MKCNYSENFNRYEKNHFAAFIYFFLNIAQSNSKIYGTAEVTSKNEKLNSGIMEVTGYVYVLGEKAQIISPESISPICLSFPFAVQAYARKARPFYLKD
ncbi:hypothetical protein D0809_16855 [Flavobacterium circumlabens]|uniref:Uncharacterized protein n=1 Tax=Flavobacterium circumlabens TaxID=2133765 RepID=A0A4Y7U9Z1_9FLAO|nr:hypothetical protein D0809_16855 [Flavobacterium circumlabens]